MNLTLFFRLIVIGLAQGAKNFTYLKQTKSSNAELFYSETYFHCPLVYAKDGFHVSLQINHGNYCESENGYRKLGHTYDTVEFGFPSLHDDKFVEFAESSNDVTQTVGRIPVSVLEEIFESHSGIDWEKTISVDSYNRLLGIKP